MGIERITEGQLKEHAEAIALIRPFQPYALGVLRDFCARIGIEVAPDPPKPKVLAWSPSEATVLLGKIIWGNGSTRRVVKVHSSGVEDSEGDSISFLALADSYQRVNTGEPCGATT